MIIYILEYYYLLDKRMDLNVYKGMTERVAASAQSEEKKPLDVVDEAVDAIIVGVQAITSNIEKVETETTTEKKALGNVKDLIETAIAPYLADIVKEMDVFDSDE